MGCNGPDEARHSAAPVAMRKARTLPHRLLPLSTSTDVARTICVDRIETCMASFEFK